MPKSGVEEVCMGKDPNSVFSKVKKMMMELDLFK